MAEGGQEARRPLIFEYYYIDCEKLKDGKTVKGKCKSCKKEFRGQVGVTSNFLSDLKVSEHQSLRIIYDLFLATSGSLCSFS